MADRHRSFSPCGAQALPKAPRRASALQKRASACPNTLAAPFSLSPSPRAAPCPQQAPPLPTVRRHHCARLPLRKRVAQSACSLTVVFSTFSTSPSVQSSLGKGESSVFFHHRHGCPRRSWHSMRPAVLAPLPSLLCLALGSRSAAEARRVALSGCDAVASPEPAVPWPSVAVAIATPSSCVSSCNKGFP